jgi:hypothetical protein
MYFLPPFFITTTPPNMSTNSSDAWHLPCNRKINAQNINIVRFRRLISSRQIHNTPISLLPEKVPWWEAVGIPHHTSLKTGLWTMQLMLAACVAYLLPFWPIHLPASAVHTSTSSSPMAGKAFAYSLDCQSRIIANFSFKVSLSESGITKTAPDQ